jgi:hypothetical protein
MVHFEFGQDRLTQPLNSFELAQGAIKVPLEPRLVSVVGGSTIAISRTRPWPASRRGCRGRRLSTE